MSVNQDIRSGADNVQTIPFFSTEFYRYYAETPGLAAANHYIATLAKEYLLALEHVIKDHLPASEAVGKGHHERIKTKQLLIFYPAMQWVHLMALNLAMQQVSNTGPNLKVEHRLCLMYNPGRDYSGEVINATEWLSYKLACKSLAEFANVKMFASDQELADHYGHLLELDKPMRLHPQYLVQLGQPRELQKVDKQGQSIGLYFGDAKVEKGFTQLPDLIERLIPAIGENDKIVIQYVSQGNCRSVLAAEEQIQDIAEREPRLRVTPSYLSSEQMQTILSSLDLFVFTYDAMHYRNKSSGFLWMLADKACKLIFLGESWLVREAKRLGMNAYLCGVRDLPDFLHCLLAEANQENIERSEAIPLTVDAPVRDYRKRLNSSFFDWLLSDARDYSLMGQ
ncbi:hypothetical protein [Microbulbifer sp. SAOS-129_SWC]|uniref:hypothetical protein n=1 Tax=Microbulbifer sp. SAOS-129_SWC TaxID=3145235 RepID=UPI003216F192